MLSDENQDDGPMKDEEIAVGTATVDPPYAWRRGLRRPWGAESNCAAVARWPK